MSRLSPSVLLAVGPFVVTAVAAATRIPVVLPVMAAMVAWPVFSRCLRAGRLWAGFGWMLYWAAWQSLAVVGLVMWFPELAASSILNGPAYAAEMLHWVRTGIGPEGSPRLFLPIHAAHLAAFCVLCVATAGTAALALGAFLLNYMNFYVVTLVQAAAEPGLAAAMGWPVWAVLRVVGFIAVATGLTPHGLAWWSRRRGGEPHRPRGTRPWILGGLTLVILDVVLKAALAPTWRTWLLRALEGTGV